MDKEIWFACLFFLVVFVMIYVITYIMNVRKWKKKKLNKIGEYHYLVMKFKLDTSRLNVRKMLLSFSIIDAFIIAFVTTFITMLPLKVMWQLLIGFVLLVSLIYSLYEIYGRHLENQSYQVKRKKEEK